VTARSRNRARKWAVAGIEIAKQEAVMNRRVPTFRGALLKESLNDETVLERLKVTTTSEFKQPRPSPDQPSRWTAIFFEGNEDEADEIAEVLSGALKPRGWYADFATASHKYVVLPKRVFKYALGDRQAEADAKAFARSVGVPERQLDWPEPQR
jgi:hypothetical protein